MPSPSKIDPGIKQWATDSQTKYIDAAIKHGSIRAAAVALGVNFTTIYQQIKAAESKAASKGFAPAHDLTKTIPDPLVMKGTSTLYGDDGNVKLQWVKTKLDDAQWEQVKQAALAALSEELPRLKSTPFSGHVHDHLANLITLTDSHVGMLAWNKESGEDWDLKIAERTLVGCFDQMIQGLPPAGVCIVNQLGDFLHQDGLAAVTPMHGHNLDSDGRFPKIVEVAVRILRRVIGLALARHERVVVLLAEGNHDMVSSIWLRAMFAAIYENEPRVSVIDSSLPYYVHQHGETMIAFHHGHLSKNASLPLLMAAQFPKVWGATTKRYVHVGHRHHVEEKEHNGITVVQHPTLAARDAYAARGGWIAERQATAVTYHRRFGQVSRITVTPEMLEEA